jgi:pentose-5-phosphate-3-epimerase
MVAAYAEIDSPSVPWKEWIRTVEVEPSLYAADLSRLGEQCEVLLRAGVRILHFDVGDGHFVPPITMGPIVLQSISPLVHRLGGVLDLCMSIEPGYSGQPFMPEALSRIRRLRELLGDGVPIQVDGGIDEENVRAVHEAGATLFVAGTAIFGHEDLPRAYRRLVQQLA